jgi:hypothetical protein
MTTPQGKLAWSQAENYDAVDDRAVIAAVTNGRLGLLRPVVAVPGTGLQVIIRAPWVGVASCDDNTSAVVGSREEVAVPVNPGPGTGSREDVIWCDTNPDEGYWELRTLTVGQSTGRSGIPLVWLTVPANANLASQMTIRPVDASIERRLMSYSTRNDTTVYSSTSHAAALAQSLDSQPVMMEPGQWYRVRYQTSSAQLVAAANGFRENGECRIGIGYRTAGQPAAVAVLAREAAINFSYVGGTTPGYQQAEVEWVFRHSVTDQRFERVFSGRMWALLGGCQYRVNGGGFAGSPQMLTVEDIGS